MHDELFDLPKEQVLIVGDMDVKIDHKIPMEAIMDSVGDKPIRIITHSRRLKDDFNEAVSWARNEGRFEKQDEV